MSDEEKIQIAALGLLGLFGKPKRRQQQPASPPAVPPVQPQPPATPPQQQQQQQQQPAATTAKALKTKEDYLNDVQILTMNELWSMVKEFGFRENKEIDKKFKKLLPGQTKKKDLQQILNNILEKISGNEITKETLEKALDEAVKDNVQEDSEGEKNGEGENNTDSSIETDSSKDSNQSQNQNFDKTTINSMGTQSRPDTPQGESATPLSQNFQNTYPEGQVNISDADSIDLLDTESPSQNLSEGQGNNSDSVSSKGSMNNPTSSPATPEAVKEDSEANGEIDSLLSGSETDSETDSDTDSETDFNNIPAGQYADPQTSSQGSDSDTQDPKRSVTKLYPRLRF